MIPLRFVQEHPDLDPPTYAHEGDAGFDLRAAVPAEGVLLTETWCNLIPTGLHFDIPLGYELQIRPRSGLSQYIRILNSPGTVDAGFEGELMVLVSAQPNHTYRVHRNERIAQAVLAPVTRAHLLLVEKLDAVSARGANGFGSSGKL